MQDSQREKAFLERRLEKACRYVSDLWMPVNPTILAAVNGQLDKPGASQIDSIVKDLHGDCALYIYCLRELTQKIRESGAQVNACTMGQLIEQAGLDNLKAILAVEPNDISRHGIHSTNSLQAARFQELLCSASTAQVLCEDEEIDTELGYSAALMRQLGLTLIAWNYPGVYEQAVSRLKPGESLDMAISRQLGYSPSLLAMRLASNWGLPAQFLLTLSPDSDAPEEEYVTNAVAETLANICRIGEKLARANHPQIYPDAEADWNSARIEIEERLGPTGIAVIQKRFETNCVAYIESAPAIFKPGLILDPVIRIATTKQVELIERNPYVPLARDCVRHPLTEFYKLLETTRSSKEQIQFLVTEVIPSASFSAGIVYTVEPIIGVLLPQLKIAQPERDVGEVRISAAHDMVSSAFNTSEPIVQDHFSNEERLYTSIAGIIGVSQRFGVLYLELSRLIYQQSPEKNLIHFKAIALALSDCLARK